MTLVRRVVDRAEKYETYTGCLNRGGTELACNAETYYTTEPGMAQAVNDFFSTGLVSAAHPHVSQRARTPPVAVSERRTP